MRTWMLAALTLFAVGLIDARPASAAWSCVGPEYVCGSAPSATSSKSSYKKSAYSGDERPARASRKAKAKTTATASSWWGEEPAAPARKAKKRTRQVASASYGGDEPAPRAKQRRSRSVASSYDDGGSSYQSGMASYYWQPQRVASGGWFNPNAMTAAHKTLPFGTRVRVTNKRNGQSVVVTINDRGPYVAGRVIDLSSAAAGAISMKGAGVAPVAIAVLGR